MILPFTIAQFLGVFAAYNAAIWPTQIVAYALGLIVIAALGSGRPPAAKLILSVLALMWAINAIGYQFLYFSAINPMARVFAGVFILESFLLAGGAVAAREVSFRIVRDFRSIAGMAFIVYVVVLYPMLGIWAGHGLMAGPMFGVAPCPTVIFTIGLLLVARGRLIAWLSIIPFLWSLVGLAAALQLDIREDFGLPVAGIVLMTVLAVEASRAFLGQGYAARS